MDFCSLLPLVSHCTQDNLKDVANKEPLFSLSSNFPPLHILHGLSSDSTTSLRFAIPTMQLLHLPSSKSSVSWRVVAVPCELGVSVVLVVPCELAVPLMLLAILVACHSLCLAIGYLRLLFLSHSWHRARGWLPADPESLVIFTLLNMVIGTVIRGVVSTFVIV